MKEHQNKLSLVEMFSIETILGGSNYLEKNTMLSGLLNIDKADLNEELQKRIENLLSQIKEETIGVEWATVEYQKLMHDIDSFRWEKKYLEEKKERALLKNDIFLTLTNKLNMVSLPYIENGNLKKLRSIYQIHEEVLKILSDTSEPYYISIPSIALLYGLSYENILEDRMLLNRVRKNISIKYSKVYVKETQYINDNCDFSSLLEEDGEYYMISFNADGSVKKKDPVELQKLTIVTKEKENDIKYSQEERIISKKNHGFYTSINEKRYTDANGRKVTYLERFTNQYEISGISKKLEAVCLGINKKYALILRNDIISIEERPSFIFMVCLSEEEEETYESYKNIDFLVSEIEKQMAYTLKLYKKRQMALKR